MLIDTHCHLNFPEFDPDRKTVIGNAKKSGVKKFIVPGVDIKSSHNAVNLAKTNPGIIYAAVGIHPYGADHSQSIDDLEHLINSTINSNNSLVEPQTQIVAIGECGLDYRVYGDENAIGKKDIQKTLFSEQLNLANKYHLPVIIHCRDAWTDIFDVLDSLSNIPNGVMHCFSSGLQDLRETLKRGLYCGIDGNVTYSKQVRYIVPQIPVEKLLIETDSPLLTPIPHRGKRNEPKNIVHILKSISELTNIDSLLIEQTTTNNASRLFHLS